MPKVTILGAGVIGMTIASQLPIDYEITIVGKHLPGDDMHLDYTSQWAGAIWLGVHDCSPREQAMQLDALAALWRIAGTDPESSARRITMHETMDYGSVEDVWYRSKVPNFRMISPSELPKGAKWGMQWDTVVITPPIFLRWLQIKLEKRGVVFKRLEVRSLADLKDLGHEVLINASGWGSSQLLDVQEKRLVPIKQQNIRVRKSGYNRLFIRRGDNGNYYSTAFSRADGTIYIGGVKTVGVRDFKVNEDARRTIMQRAHDNQPDVFPSPDVKDYDIIADHVGVYHLIPQKDGGVRVEKEIIGGQKVVHAYGMEAGGYVFSFGLARQAAKLVSEFMFDPIKSRL